MVKIYLVILLLLVGRFLWFNGSQPQRANGDLIIVRGQLQGEPRIQRGSYQLDVDGVRAYVPVEEILNYGDYVVLRGIWKHSYIDKVELIEHKRGDKSVSAGVFQITRDKINAVYSQTLFPQQAEVLSGIVLGSADMSQELKNELANAGLIHLVVASGMNLTLLGGFCFALFTGFGVHKRWVVVFSSLAVIFYSLLAGFQPPIVRALIMFEAVMVGGLVGRKSGGLFALLAAGYLMLWVNPTLLTSFSFLLSFASMMGQIFASTIKVDLPTLLKAIVLVILQNALAIVFTAPIILIGFSRFSLISIISNLLVVWMIEPLMMGGGVAGIIGLGSIELARFLLTPLSFLLSFFLFVVHLFGSGEKFVWKIEGFNLFMAIGYYLVLFSTIVYIQTHGKKSRSINSNAD